MDAEELQRQVNLLEAENKALVAKNEKLAERADRKKGVVVHRSMEEAYFALAITALNEEGLRVGQTYTNRMDTLNSLIDNAERYMVTIPK